MAGISSSYLPDCAGNHFLRIINIVTVYFRILIQRQQRILSSSALSPNGYFCINSTHGSVFGAGCSMILLNLSSFLEEGQ
ncbi:hypothetical protein CSA37_08515 [Candidatus Fermentibacteria bacterium]|nr:MAG: hypothetical protein CSA37_08515 [Candidatus Fermentibacteria bacterium]